MAYLVKHVITSTRYPNDDGTHALQVQEALNEIGEAEIYSIQHTALKDRYDEESYSTIIVYREYEDS